MTGGRVLVLGVAVDRVDAAAALERASEIVESGAGGLIVTVNPEMIMASANDAALAEALRRAELAVADGAGVVWAARRLGDPLPERVPGIELAEGLLARAEARGWSVYFLGARPEVVRAAVARLKERHPRLRVAGARDGYFRPEEAPAVARSVAESGAQLLLMGMGVPREQHFWLRQRALLGGVAAMGVGGSFDVWSGTARRAPAWMRRRNLEWLYRLVTEPRRWRRQLALPAFALRVLAAAARARRGRGGRGRRAGA
ncbi:MAG: WecB/TagA/CpsF family glycosyltransferase [Firmicutes bacterium]|nr:WecB/TagA/CpsF family glycosyltransferase [Bacillota bacterium]